MYKKIELYFENLTRRNWGAPYHFIIVLMATAVYLKIVDHFAGLPDLNSAWVSIYTLVLFLFIIGYELYQIKYQGQNKFEAGEDFIFNAAGYFFAILPYLQRPPGVIEEGIGLLACADILPFLLYKKFPPVVCIDAGHGGWQNGATWKNIIEKNITLNAARILNEMLKGAWFNTIMTREIDEQISLSARANIANAAHADFFISLHCNSWITSRPGGMQVHYFSQNAKYIADIIQNEIETVYPYKTKWTKAIGSKFTVLTKTRMPAVLLEMPFISNPRDRALLQDGKFMVRLMNAVAIALMNIAQAQNLINYKTVSGGGGLH